MHKRDLDRLLEKAVADALGLSLTPMANTHHRTYGKPHRAYQRKNAKPVVISTRYHRIHAHAHA